MSSIKLPPRFKHILDSDDELQGIINVTLVDFGNILIDNKPYFFREYTDHGVPHIEKVLASSDNLIPNASVIDILSVKDIGYYILSVFLHDIGMHISLEGLNLLIDGKYDDIRIKDLDKLSWSDLWDDFLNEAKKFNGKQLKAIFGDENAIIRIPPLTNQGEINENDKLVIGEFIRRNHARLAHEIAIKGFPGQPQILPFASKLDIKSRNIIGLIARSHGMSLRKSYDYLEFIYGKNNRRNPNGVHATYLMILLRIADYIQIDVTRINKTILKIKTFSSPISENEHNAHLAIDHIDDKYQDDPERIFVQASPLDSKMYLKLRQLIVDIQYEFDVSWAVLGELYGNITAKPQLKYRRITSNIEENLFSNNQNYVADKFSFKANDEVTKLLIAPLYGDEPKYGIRELIQNAVDACKEREQISKVHTEPYKAKISVEVEKDGDGYNFIIKDNGVGMDLDIIKNYFLTAGASYRSSLDWLKTFVDDDGSPKVRRNGRFGIGALAAFLVGTDVYVETRKIGQITGYSFKGNLNTEQINVIKKDNLDIGTKIVVKINYETVQKLAPIKEGSNLQWYQWFVFCSPNILYVYLGNIIPAYLKFDPDDDVTLPSDWNSFDSNGYDKIFWTYSKSYTKNNITCNGIVIASDVNDLNSDQRNTLGVIGSIIESTPKIAIFDSKGYSPLSLNRNFFINSPSYLKDLAVDIFKDYIAYILTLKNLNIVYDNEIYLEDKQPKYPAWNYEYYQEFIYGINSYLCANIPNQIYFNPTIKNIINNVLSCKDGYIINYNYFIKKLKGIAILLIQAEAEGFKKKKISLDVKESFLHFSKNKISSIDDFKSAVDPTNYNYITREMDDVDARFFIKSNKYDFLFEKDKKRISQWLRSLTSEQYSNKNWTCFTIGTPRTSVINDDFINSNIEEINFIREHIAACPYVGDNIFDNLLEKYIGNKVVIPYSIADRQKKYPLAFKELDRYMQKYLK
ncbi:MAG: ATP-binding protein [Flavipsychrobacter sp.]|nr:ATP-binding protein [Flavipsychrobacter sp.]